MGIDKAKVVSAAQKYISKGQWDKALREYQKLVEDDPTDVRSQLKVADLLVKCERHHEALISYREVANFYLRDNIYEKAVGILNQALRLAPDDAALHSELGEAYYRYGRLKDAVRAYHQALKIFRAKDLSNEQRQTLERMVHIDPEDFGLRIQLAERYHKDGQDDAAVQMFEYAAQRLQEEGRQDEYIQVIERILYIQPKQTDLRSQLVRGLFDKQDFARALKYLQISFKESPNDIETLRMLSIAFERLDKRDQAVMVHRELAKLYMAQKDRHRAIASYEQALRIDARDIESLALLGDLYYHTNEYQRSLEHLERALSLIHAQSQDTPQTAKMRQELPRKIQFIRQRLNVEDSGSMPGIANTGNLRQSTVGAQAQAQAPKRDVLADIELLDDDLELEVIPQQPIVHARQPQPAPQPQRAPQPQAQPQPQPQQPRRPASNNDLMSFAQDALSDVGELNLNKLQSYPGQPSQAAAIAQPRAVAAAAAPIHEIKDIEFVPEVASPEEDKAVKQVVTETEVFLKYGLYDKATQALMELIARFPSNVSARQALVDVYLKRGQNILAADQLMELARQTRTTPTRAQAFLLQASSLLPDATQAQRLAAELGLSLSGEQEPLTQDLMEVELLDDLADDMLSPNVLSSADLVLEEESAFDLDDDELLEFEDDASIPELTEPERVALSASGSQPALDFSEERVDEMFDSLFSSMDSVSGLRVSAMGRRTLTELGELGNVDALIEQGLAKEAQRQHVQLDRSRLGVGSSYGISADGLFGGENSLSQAFDDSGMFGDLGAPHSAATIDPNASMPGLMNMDSAAMNTNYELGAAYLDMGLVEEALEEFRQATEDPNISASATYGMALCEYKLGRGDVAKQRLSALLQRGNIDAQVLKNSRELLGRLG